MGKISEVLYCEIDPNLCTPLKASEYYFYLNLVGSDSRLHRGYEEYEYGQTILRNKAIGDMIRQQNLQVNPKMGSTIFGVSSLKQRAVVITEI